MGVADLRGERVGPEIPGVLFGERMMRGRSSKETGGPIGRLASASRTDASKSATRYIRALCGRVIQSSGPLRYAIVDGMNVRDSVIEFDSTADLARRALIAAGGPETSCAIVEIKPNSDHAEIGVEPAGQDALQRVGGPTSGP